MTNGEYLYLNSRDELLRLDINKSSVIDPRLEPAFEYIQTHLTEKISVAELASLICTHFSGHSR